MYIQPFPRHRRDHVSPFPSLPPSLPPSLLPSFPYLLMPLRDGREKSPFRVGERPSDGGQEEDHVRPGHDAVGELRREGGREGGGGRGGP